MNVNEEPQELTAYLASLTPDQRAEVVKWTDTPDCDLIKPTKSRAARILKQFQAQHGIVEAGQRNHTLFKYSCCLRRCGLNETAILECLWAFSEGHCKPQHKRDNSADISELSRLAARAFRFVKVGFPRTKRTVTVDKNKRPFVIDDDRIYLCCVDKKNDYFFVHVDETRLVFEESCNGFYPRKLQEKDGQPIAIVGIPLREALEVTQSLNAKELYDAMDTHLKKYLDAPDIDRQLFIYYILYSWFYLKTNTAPYLRFLADTGNGKSRMQHVIGNLCFYPIKAGGASTPSGIMRIKEKWHGTLLIDEADLRESTTTNELIKYLNLGFEKGQYFIKTDKDNPREQDIFDPFCPKVIAMRHPFQDNATEGRLLSFAPRETTRKDIPIILPTSYEREVDELRAKIALFVMQNWTSVDGETIIDLSELKIESRLKQLAIPLSIVLQLFPDGETRLKSYLKERQQEIKRTRAASLEGMTFNGVLDWVQDQPDTKGYLTAQEVKERCGLRSTTAATKILHSIGFMTEVIKDGKAKRILVIPDEVTWKRIIQRYYFSDTDNVLDCPQQLRSQKWVTQVTQVTLTVDGLSSSENNNDGWTVWDTCQKSVTTVTSVTEKQGGMI